MGHYKLAELHKEIFQDVYDTMRREKNENTGNVLAEKMVEGIRSCLMQWRQGASPTIPLGGHTRRGSPKGGQWQMRKRRSVLLRCWKPKAKYEVYYKLILATGIHRGEASGLCWSDIDWRATGTSHSAKHR